LRPHISRRYDLCSRGGDADSQEADELSGRQRQFADAKQRLLNERKGLEMAQEALEASLAEVRT